MKRPKYMKGRPEKVWGHYWPFMTRSMARASRDQARPDRSRFSTYDHVGFSLCKGVP